jgi:hypothetical protein
MNLSQMYAMANGKSGYARSEGEIYGSLDRAGFRVYAAAAKEQRGFFIKFDESSLTLSTSNATQEYSLPADLTQIVHLAERLSASENWRSMCPIGISDAVSNLQASLGWSGVGYGSASPFSFFGPYLGAAETVLGQASQVQKIRVEPIPDATRAVQIVYTAKWLPITDGDSTVMLPDEGTHAMESFASAELCAMSDDSRASSFEAQGQKDLTSFLTWVRARQVMSPPTIRPYGPGW